MRGFSIGTVYAPKAATAQEARGAYVPHCPCMNTLTVEQQQRIIALLQQGRSLREVERITGHRRETISLYGRLAGILPRTSGTSAAQNLAA